MEILTGTPNRYRGIHVDPERLPCAAADFGRRLDTSLAQWRDSGVRVVWLPLPAHCAHLIPLALERGFEFHHCRAGEVTMTLRLEERAPLPGFATHTIGVGGLVLSDDGQILTIVERDDMQTRPDHFKFPGGMLEPGEHIEAGAVREVFEETGIETAFEGLLSFRHHHSGQFGTSNIYAVCKLRPLSREIRMDREEIGRAQWMPLEEFLARPQVGDYNKHLVRSARRGELMPSHKIDGYRADPDDYEIFTTG